MVVVPPHHLETGWEQTKGGDTLDSRGVELQEAIEDFLVACRASGLGERTIHWYEACLLRFARYAGPQWASARAVRGFLAELQSLPARYQTHPIRPAEEGKLSVETVLGYYRTLRRFFNFLVEEGILERNPVNRIKPPRPPKHAPKAIELEDLRKLILAARESSPRDLAIILFMADTGTRIGEVCNLRLDDVDLLNRMALVRGKGNKERIVFFTERTAMALKMYLAVRPKDMGDACFIGRCGPLTPVGIYGIFRRLKRRAGITGRCNPHSLRHGFAKRWLMNGGDLASLSELLGHEDIQTTKMYSVFRIAELREKHDKLSPVNQIMARGGDALTDRAAVM